MSLSLFGRGDFHDENSAKDEVRDLAHSQQKCSVDNKVKQIKKVLRHRKKITFQTKLILAENKKN